MTQFTLTPIGSVEYSGGRPFIRLAPGLAPALQGLEGFSHLQVLWWFDRCDDDASRAVLSTARPYRRGPEHMGAFATRSPQRPNPLALTTVEVLELDAAAGCIEIAYTDAAPGSPVLDLKPYTPSLDRVEKPRVPAWCAHWPKSTETSGGFDWGAEFNF